MERHEANMQVAVPLNGGGPSTTDEYTDPTPGSNGIARIAEVGPDGAAVLGVDGFDGAAALEQPTVLPPGRSLTARFVKRSFDVVVASLLIVLAAPLLLLIGIAIWVDSRGAVLFKSRRIGRNGVAFDMLKFRTMIDGADGHRDAFRGLNEASDGMFKISKDPRVTRLGRFLRSTSLDELPQLVHVLTGKMSLVGPRPLVAEESARIPADSKRFRARPGITGPSQLAGTWRLGIPGMVDLDVDYLDTWSVWVDVKLVVRTIGYAAARHGV